MKTTDRPTSAIVKTYCEKCNNADGCFERADNQCLDRHVKLREVEALETIGLHLELIYRHYAFINKIS